MHRPSLAATAAALLVVRVASAQPDSVRAPDTTRAPRADSVSRAVKISGLLQVWYLSGHTLLNAHDTYRIRRADLKLAGDISRRVRWRLSVDAAKLLNVGRNAADSSNFVVDQRGRILQEASIEVDLRSLRADIGQQIIPLSLEGTTPSSRIETIERAMFISERARAGALGDIRDIGAALRGRAWSALDYQLGVFNEAGESQNSIDQNDQKALIGRISLLVPGTEVRVGGSGAFEGGPAPAQRRERAGAEAQLARGWLTVRSEVMGARDGALRRLGYYVLAAARVHPAVELATRWDNWDPDLQHETGAADAFERQVVVGGSYFLDGATRLAANLVRSSFPRAPLAPSTLLLLSIQVSW